MYIGPTPKPKKNGNGVRYVYDTKPPLKRLLTKINRVFFEQVHFPSYLHGSIKRRDPVSNASMHAGARTVVKADIEKFFDHITDQHVFSVWRRLFGFGEEPASLLTQLTTHDGRVFQGTPTASYLANLVFWEVEPQLVEKIESRNVMAYSRYIDDITISSKKSVSRKEIEEVIACVYGMIGARGFKPARNKMEIRRSSGQIVVTGLTVNKRPAVPRDVRAKARAAVHRLTTAVNDGKETPPKKELDSAAGKVAQIKRLHPNEGTKLSAQVRKVRDAASLRSSKKLSSTNDAAC